MTLSNLSKPIVVFGSINMDLVARTPMIPRAGQTLIGTAFNTTPGGKGANQAVAVARLGYPVHMIGAVGDDVFAQALLDNLRSSGVDASAVQRVSGPSGVAPIAVADSGENSIIVVPGANAKVDGGLVDRYLTLIESAGMVLCQLELPIESTLHMLEVCAGAQVPVILDPAPAADLPHFAWPLIQWCTPNETEAILYAGTGLSAEQTAQKLLALGLQGVVLKRGAEGAYVATSSGEAAWIKPFPVRAIDTVAAGDCFNGAFAVALMEGNSPVQAARFASAAAALSVTRRGAQASMPSRAEANAMLAANP
jgi:ribokinase